jgi:glycosyltransferase involved in cell wall biosynthesis
MKITVLMSVWNSSLWLPYSLRGIYDFADSIVVIESCWVPRDRPYETSPDGTADIVKYFQKNEDHSNKVLFHQQGTTSSQVEGRNSGIYLVPSDTDYVYMVDSDEFYMPEDLRLLRKTIEHPNFSRFSTIVTPAKCFYFDFTYYKPEPFVRGYRWFSGQRFYAIASMMSQPGETLNLESLGIEMFHYSYVSTKWTKTKACIGEDLPADKYRAWWENIYSKFDGTNLEELYSKNEGGIHPFGGGKLDRYFGEHPPVLDNHPLRHRRWGEEISAK